MGKDDSGGTITSVDGTRTISLEEFDRLAEEGSDEVSQFFDWSKARRPVPTGGLPQGERVYVSFETSRDLLDRLDAEAKRLGTTRGALALEWIAGRLRQTVAE